MNKSFEPHRPVGPKCGCCLTGVLERRERTEEFDYETDSGVVTVLADRVPVNVCTSCGSVFVMNETAVARHEYVCKTLGLITPAQIKRTRENHNLSQAEFARITGFGEASLSRWERGRLLPNVANSKYLQLLQSNPHLVKQLIADYPKPVEGDLPSAFDWGDQGRRFPHLPTAVGERRRLIASAARFSLIGAP